MGADAMGRKARKKKKDDTPEVSEAVSGDIDDLDITQVMDARLELPADDDATAELPRPKKLAAASGSSS
jgi:hypothetical protein